MVIPTTSKSGYISPLFYFLYIADNSKINNLIFKIYYSSRSYGCIFVEKKFSIKIMFIMKNKNPLWYEVINTFKREGMFVNGVTIPFLIGAYEMNGSNIDLNSSNCVKFLLDELERKAPEKPFVQQCNILKDFVVSFANENDLNNGKNYSFQKDNEDITILFDENFQTQTSVSKMNSNNISNYFYNKHKNALNEKKFSLIDGKWQRFSGDEEYYLKRTINNLSNVNLR
jgi:hypothetical protein